MYKITKNGVTMHTHINSEESAREILAGLAASKRAKVLSSSGMKLTIYAHGLVTDVYEVINQD